MVIQILNGKCGGWSQGAIVNISSGAAVVPRKEMHSYGVAKAALDKLTKDLAFEYAPKGVRVNSIVPGEAPISAVQFKYQGTTMKNPSPSLPNFCE